MGHLSWPRPSGRQCPVSGRRTIFGSHFGLDGSTGACAQGPRGRAVAGVMDAHDDIRSYRLVAVLLSGRVGAPHD